MFDIKKQKAGILLCVFLGLVALFLSKYLPIGSVTMAIILGCLVGNFFKLSPNFNTGISYCEKNILAFAIALLGVNLNYNLLEELGFKTIIIIVCGIIVTISSSVLLSKSFNFNKRFGLLIGIGNAICGSSAIAATYNIIGSKKEEVGLAIAIVNFLGTIGIFLLPFIGAHILKFTDLNSGILIGNTLQAVGQVIAASFSISDLAGQTATIVKMVRILMLTPLVFILIFIFSKKLSTDKNASITPTKNKIPLFIIGFIFFSIIPTFQLLDESFIKILSQMSHYALIVAMAGIGLNITFQSVLRDGREALKIGVLVFIIQICFTSSMLLFI